MEALKYVTGVCGDASAVTPEQATFEIDMDTAVRIAALSRSVTDAGAHRIEVFDERTIWIKAGCDKRVDVELAHNHECVDRDVLVVTASQFWFAGYLEHTDARIWTEPRSVDEMLTCLGLEQVPSVGERAIDLLGNVARMGLWDWLDSNGDFVSEIDPPSEGLADSHAALMNLIEAARFLLGKQSAIAAQPVIHAGSNDLVLETIYAPSRGIH